MNSEQPYAGVLRYITARWPTYLIGFGGGIVFSLVLITIAVERGLWPAAIAGFLLLLIVAYFFTTSVWAAHEQFNQRQNLPSHVLFELGQIMPTDNLVYVGLGLRDTPIQLSRRLTRGHLDAIDVYNPHVTPGPVLARLRRPTPPTLRDPRLTWIEGSIDLLPLPDASVELVAMSYTLVEFWQHGDRQRLLTEIRRILRPEGHLLLAEPARTRTQLLMLGPAALRLPPPEYWRRQLRDAGFNITREKEIAGYYFCFRAEKPLPGSVQQLALDLGI